MKTEQEKIEEMAKVIQKIYITKISRNEYCLAQDIYKAGYRKASDVIDLFEGKMTRFIIENCCIVDDDVDKILKELRILSDEMRQEERKDD